MGKSLIEKGNYFMGGESFQYSVIERTMSSLISLVPISSYQIGESLAESFHCIENNNIKGNRKLERDNRGYTDDI